MKYNILGKTGIKVSALGFGSMRLPMVEVDGKRIIDEEKAIPVIRRAYELGINYFDSAYNYGDGQSEVVLGKALRNIRQDVYVSTKSPVWLIKSPDDYRRYLNIQLERLQMNYIDFYYMHSLRRPIYTDIVLKHNLLAEAAAVRSSGLVKYLGFSYHDHPSLMKELIDTGCFDVVICQYNLLDRRNEEMIAYAKEKGLGVLLMGPVGGGRIASIPPWLAEKLGIKVASNAELALRFVFANPNVDCALSGMSNIAMLEENAAVASRVGEPLQPAEIEAINNMVAENSRYADLYCTGCNYCMPCPKGVNIPFIFRMMNSYKIYDLKDYARQGYAHIGSNISGKRADACVKCGACESKCPQHLPIIKQLQESHEVLRHPANVTGHLWNLYIS